MRMVFVVILLFAAVWADTSRAAAPELPALGMIRLDAYGRQIEGVPLAWGSNVVHVLGRDGRLWSIEPGKAKNFQRTAPRFQSYSVSEIRAALLRDLGHAYEVSGTTHYLVAHPRGTGERWAHRFEDLYREFARYFSVRGFAIVEPPFPLIGIVCRDRADFRRFAAGHGTPIGAGVLGLYDLTTNRITVYDIDGPARDGADWRLSASTIVHEATHQIAFNTGIHSRWSPPPLWVIEGLATLFEAPGVHGEKSSMQRIDRVNRERLQDYRAAIAGRHNGRLPAALVASDQFFETSPAAAYAEAWALTFYLVETQPRLFARYLKLTASHPPFADYTARQRVEDFTSVFGDNWELFDAKFGRFMEEIP